MFLSAYYEPKAMQEIQADLGIASALQDDRVKEEKEEIYEQL